MSTHKYSTGGAFEDSPLRPDPVEESDPKYEADIGVVEDVTLVADADCRAWDHAQIAVGGHLGDRWEARTGRSRHELRDAWQSGHVCECPNSVYDHARLVESENVVLLARTIDGERYVTTVKFIDYRANRYDSDS